MKLLITRNQQKKGMMGKQLFTITARAELTNEEAENVSRYKMNDWSLYFELPDETGKKMVRVASSAVTMGLGFGSIATKITVGNLEKGTTLECKNITDMLVVENEIIEAAKIFKSILDAAATFGGEVVVDI